MKFKQGQIIQTQSMPLTGWYLRWILWVISGFACVGYLSGVLTTQPLTLLSLLLLTGTYGAWLVIRHIGLRRCEVRAHPWWLLALFCLACASQFIPLPGTNYYWLLLLPVITTGLMTAIKPRSLGLLAAGALCLSSYLALRRIIPNWDDVSGQLTLPLSFLSTYGYGAIIRELVVARAAKDASATQLEARGDPRLREELLQARQVAKACLTEVRHSVEALRPDEASAGSLQEQLRKLVAEFEATCRQTRITLDLEEATHPLNPDLCLTLYRCAQEALTNIRKHAHATKVLLRLSTSGGEEGQVELTVLDNGQGGPLEHEQRASGFGLRGMRERVALLDGTLRAGPQPGGG